MESIFEAQNICFVCETDKKGKVSAKFCQFCPAIGLPYLDSASRRVRYYAKFAISNYVIKLKFIDYKRGKEVD